MTRGPGFGPAETCTHIGEPVVLPLQRDLGGRDAAVKPPGQS